MATREEKKIRIELPSTSGVECEIRESLSRDEFIFTFIQNERALKSCPLSGSRLNQDEMVDLLSDVGVEFFSFSAIFDVADLLINSIKKEFQKLGTEEEKVVERAAVDVKEEIEDMQVSDTTEVTDDVSPETRVSAEPTKKVSIDPSDKSLKKFEMPYSQGGYAEIYYCRDGKYAIVILQKETPIFRKKFPKDAINDDNLVAMITESGIDFLSFSAIYDSAEEIKNIILHPEEYLEAEEAPTVISDEGMSPEEATVTISEEKPLEDEMVMVDLSSLDVSEYTKAEDFDKFVVKVTDFVNEGQPLPVKEIEIEKSGGVVCIILRQMDSWFIRFRKKDGTHSEVSEIKIDQDEIARLINQEIPQISFSYLYDASEKVFLAMEQLSERPMADVILNVAVGHFLQVIEQHETEGELKAAANVTEVLLKRFRREKNTKGILQFGKKLLGYLEEQNKITQATKLRNELAEELLGIEAITALEYVLDSLDVLVTQEKFLNAANLCGLLLDHYLAEEESVDALKHTLTLGRKQIDFYRRARLPVVMWENALRYAHYAVKQLAKFDDEQVTGDQRETYQEDVFYLLDQAFELQEEQKAQFELMESLENTLKLFQEVDDKASYSKYVDKLLVSLETQDKKAKALEVAVDSSKFLLDSENYVKACEYGNQSIKLFYELKKVPEAVDFSLDVVRGLIDIKETTAARDYLKFAESLIDRAYKPDEKPRIEKQLIIGDLFGKLGLKDKAKAYIQTALQTIGDAKKREKIVLKYIDELLIAHAVLSAQEMVNLELSRLLNDKKIKDVLVFCRNFIVKLREHKQSDMVFEYMKYCANLMIQTDTKEYKVLLHFIKDLQESNEIDRAAYVLDQLITLQNKQGEYTRTIDNIGRFTNYLLENTERFDLVETFVLKIAEAYRQMGDPEGAVDKLISFQKQTLENSVELAQKITDLILKELEQKDDYKRSINLVSPLIEKQMEQGKYQDAYIFSVQNARYYERLGDISKVIQYLEKVRDKFLGFEQFEDANRMTDLILRFGRSHKEFKLAIASIKNYSKNSLDRGDTETATKFAIELVKLLKEENQAEKALEFLHMFFNTVFEEDKKSAYEIFQQIIEIRAIKEDFKTIGKKYLEPLLHDFPDIHFVEIARKVMKPPFEDFFAISEKIFDYMLNLDDVSEDVAEAVVNFVLSVYEEGQGEIGDRIANKYATKLLNIEQIPFASRLMATVLEKTEKPLAEVLPDSFRFIKELINNSLLEGAREYTDLIINMITTEKRFGSERLLLAAKITEKFSVYVASENPDLASEYAYQSASYYRSLNDFDGVVSVYSKLAKKASSPKRAIRTFKRGINICKKFNAHKHEAKLLYHLTEYLITTKNAIAIASFQQTLEKFEELQDLDDLFDSGLNLIKSAIESDNLKIAYTYLDYIARLSTMINKTDDVGGIVVFLLRNAEEVKDTNRIDLIRKYIDDLGIKPKKYRKEYKTLVELRTAHLGEKLEVDVIEPEPELTPELVKTDAIVPPAIEVPVVEPSEEAIEDKLDEEIVDVIKQIRQEPIIEPPIEEGQPSLESILPVPDEYETVQPEPEIKEQLPQVPEEIVEIAPPSKTIALDEPALSDDEITSLFSMKPPSDQEIPSSEIEIPIKSVPQPIEEIPFEKEVSDLSQAALSEKEVDSLFIPSKKTLIPTDEHLEVEEAILEDEEWEVDSFGRLWKKGTLPSETEELDRPESETKTHPREMPLDTPDITPLERFLQEEEEVIQPTIEPDVETTVPIPVEDEKIARDVPESTLDEVLAETQTIIAQEAQIEPESKPSADEKVRDIFDVPEVSYEKITPNDEYKESEVQVPDLSDLFSDALSELGGISGEAGEAEKDKKKKK